MLKKFLWWELLLTISIGFISLVLFQTVLKNYYFPAFWVLLGVITILTGLFHYSLIHVNEKKSSKFSSRFMMVTGLKMMIYLVFITTYALLNPQKAKIFLISFFILYLVYTVFEVFLIVRYFKKK